MKHLFLERKKGSRQGKGEGKDMEKKQGCFILNSKDKNATVMIDFLVCCLYNGARH